MFLGSFTKSVAMSDDAQKVFDKALESLSGVSYEPLAYATKVVNGIVYRFFCSAEVVVPEAKPFDAYVFVLVPPGGEPTMFDIKQIN
ncbi:MAG: hypothetical protein FWG70_09710 [Oscillospiraceae bacterium]|nr:hypothetical protein [Oscillospiraceae bacterium]